MLSKSTNLAAVLVGLGISAVAAPAQVSSIDAFAAQVRSAYAARDFAALAPMFADAVLYDGEVQLLADIVEGRRVMHDSTVLIR
jgi:hypothetical protein